MTWHARGAQATPGSLCVTPAGSTRRPPGGLGGRAAQHPPLPVPPSFPALGPVPSSHSVNVAVGFGVAAAKPAPDQCVSRFPPACKPPRCRRPRAGEDSSENLQMNKHLSSRGSWDSSAETQTWGRSWPAGDSGTSAAARQDPTARW